MDNDELNLLDPADAGDLHEASDQKTDTPVPTGPCGAGGGLAMVFTVLGLGLMDRRRG